MKLYRKQLNSIEELEREKIKLRYQKVHLDQIRHESQMAQNGAAMPGLLGTIMDLAGNGDATNIAFQVGKMLMGGLGKKRRSKIQAAAHLPKQKSTGRKVVEDILWSYLLGKALRVSTNIFKDVIREKKRGRQLKRA